MAANMFLYWGSGSTTCWRVMLALEEKGLQGYGNKQISFDKKEHKSEEVLNLNPRGQVPTFKDGDVGVNESLAICDYLECQNLMKAIVENIAIYIYSTNPEDISQKHLDEKKKEAREELQRWEDYMKEQGDRTYVAGKNFTMADVYFFPVLAFGVRGQLNLDHFPALHNYYQRLEKRPSVVASWPPHWNKEPGRDFYVGV